MLSATERDAYVCIEITQSVAKQIICCTPAVHADMIQESGQTDSDLHIVAGTTLHLTHKEMNLGVSVL